MPERREDIAHREVAIGPVGPWRAIITVEAVKTNHGRKSSLPHDHLFEIAASWLGPPAVGFPPSPVPVQSRDTVIVTTLEEARHVALQAAGAFQNGGDEAPDLRDFLTRNRGAFAPRVTQADI